MGAPGKSYACLGDAPGTLVFNAESAAGRGLKGEFLMSIPSRLLSGKVKLCPVSPIRALDPPRVARPRSMPPAPTGSMIYLNEDAKPFTVEPVAKNVNARLLLPVDVEKDVEQLGCFEKIQHGHQGHLDFLHSIAYCPKEDLHGRVTVCVSGRFRARHGRLGSFVHPHGTPRRAADARWLLHSDGQLLRRREGGQSLQHHGTGQGRAGGNGSLPRCRASWTQGHPRQRPLARSA